MVDELWIPNNWHTKCDRVGGALNQEDQTLSLKRGGNLRKVWMVIVLLVVTAVLPPAGPRAQWKTRWNYEGEALMENRYH
jgi:hypothetical protein